jgi:hypothetical protein
MVEDAAKVAPHVYKVLFENQRARVLEVTMEPGPAQKCTRIRIISSTFSPPAR